MTAALETDTPRPAKQQPAGLLNSWANLLLFIVPCVALATDDGVDIAAALLLLTALAALPRLPKARLASDEKIYLGIVAAFSLTAVLSILVHSLEINRFDTFSRFLLMIPVYWLLRSLALERAFFIYGLAAGCIGAGLLGLFQVHWLELERARGFATNAITFGNLAIAMTILLGLLGPLLKPDRAMTLLFGVALLLGLTASLLSGSRGGWVVLLPALIGYMILHRRAWGSLLTGLALICVAMVVVDQLLTDAIISARIELAAVEFSAYLRGEVTGSIGQRLEIWKAATILFSQSPWLGIGLDQFNGHLNGLIEEGLIDPRLNAFLTIHNSYLGLACELGLLGLITLLLLLFYPLRILLGSYARAPDLSMAGILWLASFAIFCLTNSMFRVHLSATVFPLFLFILMALTLNQPSRPPQTKG
jgi:O-antigen ligase